MKMYVTEYAARKGVIEIEVTPDRTCDGYVGDDGNHTLYPVGVAAFSDYEEARSDALKRIDKRRRSLDKQIAKLEKLRAKVEQS